MSEIARLPPTLVAPIATLRGAEGALTAIALCEGAETLFAYAKDPRGLYEAIRIKLSYQAAYAVWRQDVAVPSQQDPALRGKRAGIAEPRSPLPATDPGKDVIARWRVRLCSKVIGTARWVEDRAKLAAALDDAGRRCVRICEQEKDGTIRGTEGTGEFERYTPARYIELAREVLGEIDLDPASSEYAQETVQAAQYFTAEDDGLARQWRGRVWLNPPYHRELAPLFVRKLLYEWDQCSVTAAIMLTNNSTDAQWFCDAAVAADVICFTDHRIRFEVPGADPVSPTQGQAFCYFGRDIDIFLDVFKAVGWCVRSV